MELYRACDGDWTALLVSTGVGRDALDRFLTYAATFLSNIGNYFVCQGF
jgi:dipeptidyl-peptidase-3